MPQNYQKNLYYDKYRLASHKDIFPTLYELSLSETTYCSLGGRNLLAAPSNKKLEFALMKLFGQMSLAFILFLALRAIFMKIIPL
ncbi:hypothetical protein CUPS3785_01550 [Campylobacter upsaliensis]|uniref:hypothetical protein n=1 Tax=Campylobacter upsaliensis TaxID=28080 RepID=UPI002149B440|nr:hypothetical protein [Campylobacter upsaliensis]MCR2121747.1 hypothetical protein [Campylobacter upsaliensis]